MFVADLFIMLYIDELKIWMRLLVHIPFIPIIAGMGYEVLKLTAKYRNNIFFKILTSLVYFLDLSIMLV